jgi:hypothetical protein
MKIQFADSRINEYSSGGFHAVNDGKPIEVGNNVGPDLLAAKHFLDGEFVNIFEPFVPKTDKVDPAKSTDQAKAKK